MQNAKASQHKLVELCCLLVKRQAVDRKTRKSEESNRRSTKLTKVTEIDLRMSKLFSNTFVVRSTFLNFVPTTTMFHFFHSFFKKTISRKLIKKTND